MRAYRGKTLIRKKTITMIYKRKFEKFTIIKKNKICKIKTKNYEYNT